jgi:outer membrane immunogenic protein
MRKLLIAGSALAAVAAASPTQADGLDGLPGRASWTGFHAGAVLGYGWGNDDVSLTQFSPGGAPVNNAFVSNAGTSSFSPGSITAGGEAGYDYQLGHIVFGFEADFNYVGLRGAMGITSAFPTAPSVPFGINTQVSTNWLFTARPRVGYAFNRNVMVYVTGGLGVTDDRFSQTASLANGYTVSSSSMSRVGGVVGAGVDYALDEHWSAKAEYLYADFGKQNAQGTLSGPSPVPGFTWNNTYHLTTSIARVGIDYKFW